MIAMSIDLLAEGKNQGKHLRREEDNPAPEDILFGGERAAAPDAGGPVSLPKHPAGYEISRFRVRPAAAHLHGGGATSAGYRDKPPLPYPGGQGLTVRNDMPR